MKNKIDLALLSINKSPKNFYKEFLTNVLKDKVNIFPYSIEEGVNNTNNIKFVLPTHKILLEDAKILFPKSTIIIPEKTLTGFNLDKVMILPKNKKILVVTIHEMITNEVIQNLKDLGVNHLDFIPYNKENSNLNFKDIDTAVSPGMLYLCPKEIKNIIDIGGRIISIESFMDLLKILNLDKSHLNNYINIYTKNLISLSSKLVELNNSSEKLRKKLETILDVIDEGIISTEDDKVVTINPSAIKLFDINGNIVGKNVSELFVDFTKNSSMIPTLDNKENIIISNKDKKLVLSKTQVPNNIKTSIITVNEVSKIQILEQEVRQKLHKKGHIAKYNFSNILGISNKISLVKKKAKKIANNDLTVLLLGESGTGKELLAQAIHNESKRRNAPFVAINFAAITETLLESELFGYEEGAFTGAKKGGKQGVFEAAHKGTIFLDEIGDASLKTQVQLLRVLQEQEIVRIGSTNVIPINVRVIAATNNNLIEKINNNQFRKDLYYRLNILTIEVPPLRECKDDILYIITKYTQDKYSENINFSKEAQKILLNHPWPGNTRELLNVADYLHHTSENKEEITTNDLPQYLLNETDIINIEISKNIEPQPNNLSRKLSQYGNIEEFQYLLYLLYTNSDTSIGRNTLCIEMKKKNYNVTEYKIKKYLKTLNSFGLINIGTTKQGSKITLEGIEYLNETKI